MLSFATLIYINNVFGQVFQVESSLQISMN